MKTTIKVSISGIAFIIDEDAYHILNNYLNTLKTHFEQKPDGKEVVDDIEARLAELLSMRVNLPEQVVNIDDAKQVICIMGNPSDLIGDEQNSDKTNQHTPKHTVTVRKRLYRDCDNRVIAGICSGLGNYFGIDAVIFRLIFVIAALGVGFISIHNNSFYPVTIKGVAVWAYIILWIAVPYASTPQQKLEMTGKNPSIDDIEQRVHNEQQKNGNKNNNLKHELGGLAWFIGGIARIFAIFIAGCSLFIGAVALIAIIGSLFGFTYYTGVGLKDVLDIAIGADNMFIRTLIMIVIIYPIFILIYLGIKLLFRFKLRDKMIMVAAFVIWFFSMVFLAGYISTTIAGELGLRKKNTTKIETIDIKTNSDTLYLDLPYTYSQSANDAIGEYRIDDVEQPRIWLSEYNGLKTLFIVPPIRICYSSYVDDFRMELRRQTFGKSKRNISYNEENSQFQYSQNDSLILINPYAYNKNNPLCKAFEFMGIVIYVPSNKKVVVHDPLMPALSGRYSY